MTEDKYLKTISLKARSQLNNDENNPCFSEQNLSQECLSKNNYDRDQCKLHFENYRNCKSFWNAVTKRRRVQGISPHLPPLEERRTIKEKFLKTGAL